MFVYYAASKKKKKGPIVSVLSVTPLKEQKEGTGGDNSPSFSPRSPLSSPVLYRLLEGPYY